MMLAAWILPLGAARMTPPSIYDRWWSLTEACSGQSRSMADVRWYRMPGHSFRFLNRQVGGVWIPLANAIVLADASINIGPTVRHEMLHALVRRKGHPRDEFLGACGGLVTCQRYCVENSFVLPREYVRRPPDSIDVDVRAELTPRGRDGQRWMLLWAIARNPSDENVLISAPGDRRMPWTFDYLVAGPFGAIGGGEVAFDSSSIFFHPHETKRWLFDYRVGRPFSRAPHGQFAVIPPGHYIVQVKYARHESRADTLVVSP